MLRPHSSSNARPASSSTSGAAGGASSGAPPPGWGLGAGAVPDVSPSSRGAQADRGSLLEEEPKTEVSQRLLMSRGGVLGAPPSSTPDRGRGAAKPRTQHVPKAGTLLRPTLLQGPQAGQQRSMPTGELMKEEAASRKMQQLQQKEPWRTCIRIRRPHARSHGNKILTRQW